MKYFFVFSFRGHIRTRSIPAFVAKFQRNLSNDTGEPFTKRNKDETPAINRSIIIQLIVVVVVVAAAAIVVVIIVIIFF